MSKGFINKDELEPPEFADPAEETASPDIDEAINEVVKAEDTDDEQVVENLDENKELAPTGADNNILKGGTSMSCKEEQELMREEAQMDVADNEFTMNTVTCTTGDDPNCKECCDVVNNHTKRERFGYQINTTCECHDICVQDVRDICVKRRTLKTKIPCRPDGSAGCRGGFLPGGFPPPTVRSWRVLCAEECLDPTGLSRPCDRIRNEVEFEVVLNYGGNNFGVVTPKDTFDCFFYQFARFPSGTFFPNSTNGFNQWRNELAFIDGSCKVIIFERNPFITIEDNDCILNIEYKEIDKLWKNENLLVSALRPYFNAPEGGQANVTVKQEFEQGHKIGPCVNGPCT